MSNDLPLDTPAGVHRGRRAEDNEEREIRMRVWQTYCSILGNDTPHAALMAALDAYKAELGVMAVKRLGLWGIR